MDMQGTPIGSTNQGMKNTSDPAAKEPVTEAPGPIAADSLAADSTREGGAFSQNSDAAPSGVEGSKSTLANTDVSAATSLAPAPDAAAREAREAWNETAELKAPAGSSSSSKFPEAVGGQPDFPGTVSDTGYTGGPSDGSTSATGGIPSTSGGLSGGSAGGLSSASGGGGGGDDTTGETGKTTTTTSASSGAGAVSGLGVGQAGGESNRDVSPAPGYITSVVMGAGDGKPKGANLTEGGFEGTAPGNVDIGSSEDPSRVAEQGFQTANAAASGGDGPKQGSVTGKTTYDSLGSDEAA